MIHHTRSIWKRPVILAVAAVLVAVPLTVGSVLAATVGDSAFLNQSPTTTTNLPPDPGIDQGTDPGLPQVVSEKDDPLTEWLANRPEVMGPFTKEQTTAASPETVSWILAQAVHKQVMTSEEAETFRAWHKQRPDSQAAPELMRYQPSYLDRTYDSGRRHEMLREIESR